MTVALIAFDLDGTILEPDGTIAEECAGEIIRLTGLGVHCVVASGRGVDFQQDLLQEQGLARHFSALIGDERWIHLNAPAADRSDVAMELQPLEPWNTDTRRRWAELEPSSEAWARKLEDWAASQGWSSVVSDHDQSMARGLRSVRGPSGEQAETMMRWLQQQLGDGPLWCNANGSLVHIYDCSRDKGTSLLALAEHFGIAPEQVLAIGDGFNDRPMLDGRHGLQAATLANAIPEVQGWVTAAGGQVASGERGNGVAEILRQLPSSV